MEDTPRRKMAELVLSQFSISGLLNTPQLTLSQSFFLHFVLTYLSAPRDILPGAAAALPVLSLSTLSGEVRELARLAPLAPL